MSAAVYLAHEIEWMHAKDRVRLLRSAHRLPAMGGKKRWLEQVSAEFDPLAATCLADLIEKRMMPSSLLNRA